jgi:hypothetical protein
MEYYLDRSAYWAFATGLATFRAQSINSRESAAYFVLREIGQPVKPLERSSS